MNAALLPIFGRGLIELRVFSDTRRFFCFNRTTFAEATGHAPDFVREIVALFETAGFLNNTTDYNTTDHYAPEFKHCIAWPAGLASQAVKELASLNLAQAEVFP